MKNFIVFLSIMTAIAGCTSIPVDAFKLSASSLQERQLQTRLFELSDEVELISAGIAVLQDMGYAVTETERDAGLVSATKNVDATKASQVVAAVFVAMLGGGSMAIDKEQKINVSYVTKPSANESGYLARVTFQRVVWDTEDNISRVETIKTEELYAEFFDKLSKSVFLEAQAI